MRKVLILLISALIASVLSPLSPSHATSCSWGSGWLAQENSKGGYGGWAEGIPVHAPAWDREAPSLRNEGSFNRFSVGCGEVARLTITKPASIQMFRLGYYGGDGARLIRTAKVKKYWSFTVDATMPPGQYVVRINSSGSLPRLVPIMIIDRESKAPITYVSAVYTWQAYNRSGGKSLYKGEDNTMKTRAWTVSFDRPYDTAGTGRMRWMETPLVKLLEENGVDINYLTDDDVSDGSVEQTTSIVVGGHSEYWTAKEYQTFINAVHSGINLISFGGNTGYRQIIVKGRTGGARMTNRALKKPESQLLGSQYFALGFKSDLVVDDSTRWPFSAMAPNSSLKDIYGYEVDSYMNAPGPAVEVLAHSVLDKDGVVATSTYYTDPSGAGVLNIGTNGWVCALENVCVWGRSFDQSTMRDVRQVTKAVIADLAQGALSKIHPAQTSVAER